MKPSHSVGLVLVAVLATVAVEESRMASLRSRLENVETSVARSAKNDSAPSAAPASSAVAEAQPSRVRERPEAKPSEAGKTDEDSGDFGKTVRKMWENPAGKSMMNQGVKMAVAMMYGDFIDGMDLTKEEAEYFKTLLGKEMADQQEIGMKMMGASAEERTQLAGEITKRAKENEEAIKAFLNNEEDYKKFETFKERLPERQQLDGIRSLMASQEVPLDAASEEKLVEAMHRARTQPNTADFSGPDAFSEMAKGNAVERFEESWTRQQETLRKEVSGVLNEKQMKAFGDYQVQMKEFQLMGIKMMSGKKEE